MNFKTFLTLFLSVTAITTATLSPAQVLAKNTSMPFSIENVNSDTIVPLYDYISSADIGVYPSSTRTKYQLNISGISSVTSVSGTATLYKYSSSGTYVKIDSETLNLKGPTILYTGYLKSGGSGKYKIEFKGTIKSSAGSESVTFRSYGSY